MHYALRFNDIEIIRNLLLAGADVTAVNNEQQTPLFYANKYSSKQIINLLIAAGSDVKFKDLHNKTAGDYKHFGDFNIAIHKNHIYSVSTMLRKFPELANCVLSDDLTPLQYAAKNKNLALVKILLNAKADPNKKGTSDYRSYTPLQFVYDFPYFYSPNNLNERTKKFNIFKELLKAGANINVNPMGHGGNTVRILLRLRASISLTL